MHAVKKILRSARVASLYPGWSKVLQVLQRFSAKIAFLAKTLCYLQYSGEIIGQNAKDAEMSKPLCHPAKCIDKSK